MANNSRQATRDAIKKRQEYENDYRSLFSFLYHNAIVVENLPDDLPKRYLLRVLKNKGAIAYDKQTKLFLPFVKQGIDIYGLPNKYNLIGYNGYTVTRNPDEVVILRANDLEYSLENYINNQVEKLVNYDLAIEQNLEAIKTMTLVEVPDQATLLSIANIQNARQIGSSFVFVNKKSTVGLEYKVNSTGAQYLIDKLRQDRKECMNETLSTIGINVANVDKKERVQDAEIRASQGFALDCITTLVETFNHDAKIGGLKIRLRANTSLYKEHELEIEKKRAEIEDLKSSEGENLNGVQS